MSIGAGKYPREKYSWYVLSALVAVYIFTYINRTILVLLVDPIKLTLGISDEISSVPSFVSRATHCNSSI